MAGRNRDQSAAERRAEVASRSRTARAVKERPGPYRYSREAIRTWRIVLIAVLLVGFAAGAAIGLSLNDDSPQWAGTLAVGLMIGSVVLSLLTAAFLGGQAIARGGGFVGVLFTIGLIGGPTGQVFEIRPLMIAGYSALVLGIILFWFVGYRAKVPMWIGLPWAKLKSWNDPGDRRDGNDPSDRKDQRPR